jgi:ribosomal protein S18 acetylase RimI-like enzyme
MADEIEIVKLTSNEWQLFKEFRLYALKNDQQAFGEPYSRAAERSDEKWQERLKQATDEVTSCMLFAKANNKLVGMIGWYRSDEALINGFGEIWGVFVHPEYRGRGIARMLMNAIQENLANQPNVKRVKLEVNIDQKNAEHLYVTCGFETTGDVLLKLGDGVVHNVRNMEKQLRK